MEEGAINIAEIIEKTPADTKFYCTILGECKAEIKEGLYLIRIYNEKHQSHTLNRYGQLVEGVGECILFPSKDQRDWSKFVIPRHDLPVSTIVRVSDDLRTWTLAHYHSKGKVKINYFDILSYRYVIPMSKFNGEDFTFDPKDNYGTKSGIWE